MAQQSDSVGKLEEYSADQISCDTLKSIIGQGGFGTVLLGKHEKVGHVAIKCFKVAGGQQDQLMVEQSIRHEFDMLIQSHHENIVYVYGFTKWPGSMGIVMQYYEGGNMSSLLLNPSIKIGRSLSLRLAAETATGVAYIHNCGSEKRMVHGDLKPENILLTSDLRCKIGDFGCAKTANYTGAANSPPDVPEKQELTLYYAAPEKLLNNAGPKKEQDTYSCGLIYHMVLFCVVPYSIKYCQSDFLRLLANGMRPNCDAIQELKDSCSDNDRAIVEKLEDAMTRCWHQNPAQRPNMLEVRDGLQQHLAKQNPAVISQQVTDAVTKMGITHPSNMYKPTVPLHHYSTRTWSFPLPHNEVNGSQSNLTQPKSIDMPAPLPAATESQLNLTQPKSVEIQAQLSDTNGIPLNLTQPKSIEIQASLLEENGSYQNVTQPKSIEFPAPTPAASGSQPNLTQPKSIEIQGQFSEDTRSQLNLTQPKSIEILAPLHEANASNQNITQPKSIEIPVEAVEVQTQDSHQNDAFSGLSRQRKARTLDRGKTVRKHATGRKSVANISEYQTSTSLSHRVLQPTLSSPLPVKRRSEGQITALKVIEAFSQSPKPAGSPKQNFFQNFIQNWRSKLAVPRLLDNPGFLVIGGEGSERDCVRYDITTNLCQPLQKLTTERCWAASVKVRKNIYVIGGGPDVWNKYHKSCEIFDLSEQKSWTELPDMIEARGHHGIACIADHIYVTGGYNGKSLSSCEKFDIRNNKWMKIKDMLNARDEHGSVVCNDSLYCVGGDNGSRLSSCEHFDVKLEKWNEVAPLITPRHSLACVVLDGLIYAIGGCGDEGHLSSVERYCPKANKWEKVASLHVARSRPRACVVQNKIFVLGGYNGGMLKSVEVYDQVKNVWTVSFETHKPVGGSTVVSV